jgi:putative spermidine/putrescine transport system permease protein
MTNPASVSARRRWRALLAPWLLVGPVFLLFAVFFAVPMLILFASSFERVDTATFQLIERFTLFNYRRFLFDAYYLGVLLTTLKISGLVTLVALVTAYPVAAYLVRARPRERALLMLLIVSPLLVSLVIRSFGWVIVLGPQGLVNVTLRSLGLIQAPLKLIYTETAVVVGLAHVFYPFMVLAIYSALQNIDPAVLRAARNLGASPARAFWTVTLPLSVPGIVAGSLIVFALSVSSFVTPTLLGGPWVKVVAYLAWEQNLVVLDWAFAAAIAVILLLVTVLIMVAYNRLVERSWFAGVFQ